VGVELMLFFSRWKVLAVLLTAALSAVPGRLIAQTATLEFRLVDASMTVEQALQTRPPASSEILYGMADKQPYLVERQVLLSGTAVCDAQPGHDQRTGEPVVMFRFDAEGRKRFAETTQANVGRPFAIVLDNQVIAVPVIREPITGGSGQISGRFTTVQVNDLAKRIKASGVTKC
jgi:protein-export membrane protein SecD